MPPSLGLSHKAAPRECEYGTGFYEPEDLDGSYDVETFERRTSSTKPTLLPRESARYSFSTFEEDDFGNNINEEIHDCVTTPYSGCNLMATLTSRPFVVNCFTILDDDTIEHIIKFSIDDLHNHHTASLTCRQFAVITERTAVIAHTVAAATQSARVAYLEAQQIEISAHAEAHAAKCKVILFEDGEWRGEPSRKKRPSGLGVFRQRRVFSTAHSAAKFVNGEEQGCGVYHYFDGSRFAGTLNKGMRHGPGVSEEFASTGGIQRHEGGWKNDQKHGFGVQMGGPFRFAAGFWTDGVPGTLIMWDYHTPDGEAERH